MSVDHNPFSTSADSAPASDQSPISPPVIAPPSSDATNATECNLASSACTEASSSSDPPPFIDATNASLCNLSENDGNTPTTNPPDSDPNPVPPHRRGVYTFHPTPKESPRGTPILANQESDQAPFRTDSQLASVPLRLPALSDQQLHAIQLTLDGYTDHSIARIVKINRSTLWRWKNFHPLFKAELSRRRNEAWSTAGDRFRRHLSPPSSTSAARWKIPTPPPASAPPVSS